MTQATYNPFDPAQVDDDCDALRSLREHDPVHEFMPGTFLVTRFEDVSALLVDSATFPQGGFTPAGLADIDFDELPMGQTDAPFHTKIRRNVASAMSVGSLREYEPVIREIADDLAEKLAAKSTADFVSDFAGPLPAEAMVRLTGIPSEHTAAVRSYTADFILTLSDENTPAADAANERMRAFDSTFLEVLAQARARPVEELSPILAGLLNGSDRTGEPITDRRVLTHFAKDILVAGMETTVHQIGNMFFQILSQDGLYERLREHPAEREAAVEESLRHIPPVNAVYRRAARDVEVAGVTIPEGSMVLLSISSANSDDSVFECPQEFRPGGPARSRKHVAFGRGSHLCVGAPLARLEARCALDGVLNRVPRMALAPDEAYERVGFISVRGPRHLNVTIG